MNRVLSYVERLTRTVSFPTIKLWSCQHAPNVKRTAWVRLGLLLPLVFLALGTTTKTYAISANNSIVVNSMTALPAAACTGHTKIDTCVKMRGTVNVTAGIGTPSLYSIDELAFIKDGTAIAGIFPSPFTVSGVPSLGISPVNSSTLGCYVLDANPGVAGVLT